MMPPYEFVQYPFQLKYVNTSTNQEELRDELILSEDNVLHTRKPTHLNEATSDNIDEHAYIHESKGIATVTIAPIIPTTRDQSKIISCQ